MRQKQHMLKNSHGFYKTSIRAQEEQQAKITTTALSVTPYLLASIRAKERQYLIVSNPTGSTVDSGSKIFSFTAVAPTDTVLSYVGAQADAQETGVRICETGSASTDGSNTGYGLFQFSPTQTYDNNLYKLNIFTHCRDYFAGLLANATHSRRFRTKRLPQSCDCKMERSRVAVRLRVPRRG